MRSSGTRARKRSSSTTSWTNRILSGKVRLDQKQIAVADVASAALDSVRPSAEAKGIALHTVMDPAAGNVTGDPGRLHQIVTNLLTNALKFTPKGGRVSVLVGRDGAHVEVAVRDSGRGIDPLFLPHVFERFRQADASSTRSVGGLGLGLSIVKQLVALHGGTVRAESAGTGTGAMFVVRLPVATAPRPSSSDDPAPTARPSYPGIVSSLERVRVLVVDDEPDSRELTVSLLRAAGATVLDADSADAALALIEAERPDVMISDIGMPGKDGWGLVRELRQRAADQGGSTPAIALTAFARPEDRARSMQAGFQMHLSKPLDLQEVLAAIASLAGRAARDQG